MSRIKIRIELEREPDPAYPNRSYNYDEVYAQTIELRIPESLISSVSNRVNEFLAREIESAGGQVL